MSTITNEFKNRTIIIVSAILYVILNHLIFIVDGINVLYTFFGAIMMFLILASSSFYGIYRIIKFKASNLKTPLIISLLAFLITFFHPVERIIEKTKSPRVLFAYCEHTMYSVSINFREDSSFEYRTGGFLTSEEYRGKYYIENDTISLNFSNKKPIDLNTKLLISEWFIQELDSTQKYNHKFEITLNEIKP